MSEKEIILTWVVFWLLRKQCERPLEMSLVLPGYLHALMSATVEFHPNKFMHASIEAAMVGEVDAKMSVALELHTKGTCIGLLLFVNYRQKKRMGRWYQCSSVPPHPHSPHGCFPNSGFCMQV